MTSTRLDSSELGPISPELVLVDEELAALARQLLPEPSGTTARVASSPPVRIGLEPPTSRPAPTRRPATIAGETNTGAVTVPAGVTPRYVIVLPDQPAELDQWKTAARRYARVRRAALLMSASLLSIAVLALPSALPAPIVQPDTSRSNRRYEAVAPRYHTKVAPVRPQSGDGSSRLRRSGDGSRGDRRRSGPARKTAVDERRRNALKTPAARSRRAKHPQMRVSAPSNVLGVVVTAGDRLVTLVWTLPPDVHEVIVRRSGGRPMREQTVYRGTGTRFADRKVRNGIAYRYVIISRDRRGNVSTGVPTVVTPRRGRG